MIPKPVARLLAPEGWTYGGYWDGLYHYFTGSTGHHINVQCSEKQLLDRTLERVCRRIDYENLTDDRTNISNRGARSSAQHREGL